MSLFSWLTTPLDDQPQGPLLQVNEMLSDVTSTGSAGAFDRMKEKVQIAKG
jgi:hypothetical protein